MPRHHRTSVLVFDRSRIRGLPSGPGRSSIRALAEVFTTTLPTDRRKAAYGWSRTYSTLYLVVPLGATDTTLLYIGGTVTPYTYQGPWTDNPRYALYWCDVLDRGARFNIAMLGLLQQRLEGELELLTRPADPEPDPDPEPPKRGGFSWR